jgi:hypothetical protein
MGTNFRLEAKRMVLDVGCHLDDGVIEAIAAAGKEGRLVTFEHSGVNITVAADSDADLIVRDWWRATDGYIGKNVGPYPRAEMTPEELASDARIEDENEARRNAKRAGYLAELEAKRDRVEARMANAMPMVLADESAWSRAKEIAKNDAMWTDILSYAERWARLMQLELSEGKNLEDVWKPTFHEADLEGMSGTTCGLAAGQLVRCWVYGSELERLYFNR